ncbi:MAG: ATP-binding cassette domain-containing protein [Acidobacteriota bacterium]
MTFDVENDVVVDVQGLSKSFGDKHILSDVGFRIHRGDAAVIIGPSGGGKTTLLRCLTLLSQPDEGSVRIGDVAFTMRQADAGGIGPWFGLSKLLAGKTALENVYRTNGKSRDRLSSEELRRLRLHCGFVFQQYNLWPNKTGLENIIEALVVVKKLARDEAEKRAIQVAEELDITDILKSYPNAMSGGQQQRLALARTLAIEPTVLLLDEITAALDVEVVADILSVLTKIRQQGRTMVLISHHLEFVKRVADRVFFLADGNLLDCGTPEEAFEHPPTERLQKFLGQVVATH